jgi:hypothetical protein
MALAAFARDPLLQIVCASHIEEYGKCRRAPTDAIVNFQGEDPEAGPLLRYTIVKPQDQLCRNIGGRCGGPCRGLPPRATESDADSRVIRFRSRTGTPHRSHRGKTSIDYFGADYSPVADLSKYESPESEDNDYRHRMVVNAIALVFVSLLSLAGVWLVNALAHS